MYEFQIKMELVYVFAQASSLCTDRDRTPQLMYELAVFPGTCPWKQADSDVSRPYPTFVISLAREPLVELIFFLFNK